MKLAALRLQNFRSCGDVTVMFDDYTCLVGQNGAGKSTILTALNVLFRNTGGTVTNVIALTEEDFCNRNTAAPIIITATFDDLAPNEAEEFRDYVRHGQLVVSAKATWDPGRRTADVKQYGARLVMRDFAPFFEASNGGAKVADLKVIYSQLREQHRALPTASSKGDMESALRKFEEEHIELCELLDSEDQFYGYTKGTNRLTKFFQWVYIPAVKDASSEQDEAKNTAFGELLQRTLRPKVSFDAPLSELRADASRRYADIIGGHQQALDDVSASLQARLRAWAHPGARVRLQWNTESDKAVSVQAPMARAKIGDDEFVGDVPRMGHGLQRAFIVAVLQELAESGQAGTGPRLLLGFEEPELYQHPPQARHLARVLEELSGQGVQVVVTTHSPYFISGRGFESVRMVRKRDGDGSSTVTSLTHAQLADRLAVALGEEPKTPTSIMASVEQILQPTLNELFFCGVPVLVEGTEDVAFLGTYLQLSGRWSEFRRRGAHFVVVGGKENMSRPLAIASGLGIPTFAVFDADGQNTKPDDVQRNRRSNACLLHLCGATGVDPLPECTFVGERVVAWDATIGHAVRQDVGEDAWSSAAAAAREAHGYGSGVQNKNALLIAATLDVLWHDGHKVPSLDRACDAILAFAAGLSNVAPPAEQGRETATSASRES